MENLGDGEFGVDGKFSGITKEGENGNFQKTEKSKFGMAQEFVKEGRRDNLEDGEFRIS